MLAHVERVSRETGHALSIRIGMATGPVMAGVIGTDKFSYDVWGDTVNMASRLESLGTPGRIHICRCRQVLDGTYGFESRGLIEIKGLGPVETWYLAGRATPSGGARGACPVQILGSKSAPRRGPLCPRTPAVSGMLARPTGRRRGRSAA